MKLVKNIINKQSNDTDLILSWLYWIEDHCSERSCDDCLYWKPFKEKNDCEIHHIYRKAFPSTIYGYVAPAYWNLPSSSIKKIQPPNLEFIAKKSSLKVVLQILGGNKNEIIKDTN